MTHLISFVVAEQSSRSLVENVGRVTGIRIHCSLAFLYLQNGDSKSKRSSHSVIDLTHKTIQKRLRDLQGFAVRPWPIDGVYTD